MSRFIISSINKAVNNNQNYIIIKNTKRINKEVLNTLINFGFIQGLELRGWYLLIHLKTQYWKNWHYSTRSLTNIKPLNFNKCKAISSKVWFHNNKLKGNAVIHIMSSDKGILHSQSNNLSGGIPLISIV